MTMLALTATSSVIWLGQSVSLILVALLGAAWLLHPTAQPQTARPQTVWTRELLAGALLLLALVKPSVSAPFLWMILWAPRDAATPPPLRGRICLGIGVLLGCGLLTLVALRFQTDAAREVADWAQTVNRNNAQLSEGYANLRAWLAARRIEAAQSSARADCFVVAGAGFGRFGIAISTASCC